MKSLVFLEDLLSDVYFEFKAYLKNKTAERFKRLYEAAYLQGISYEDFVAFGKVLSTVYYIETPYLVFDSEEDGANFLNIVHSIHLGIEKIAERDGFFFKEEENG